MTLALSAAAFLGAAADVARSPSQVAERWILLDVSASAVRGRSALYADLPTLLAPACETLRGGDRAGLVLFGRRARPIGPLSPVGDLLARLRRGLPSLGDLPEEGETNFEAALATLFEVAGPGADAVVVSDGVESGGDFRAALAGLARREIRIHARALPPAEGGDRRVESVDLPRAASVGETVLARARLAREGAVPPRGTLRWTIREGGGTESVLREELEVPGDGTLRVERAVAVRRAGGLTVRVEWEPEASDRFPENDAGAAACTVGGARRALVAGSPRLAEALGRVSWIEVEAVRAEEVAAALPRADAVVLVDVRAERLEPFAPRLLEAVEQAGVGLLVAGTREAFGPGGYRASSLRRILPVEPGPPADRPRDFLLLLDASGSMEGEKYAAARESVSRLATAASEEDSVRVAAFAGRLGPVQVWKEEGRPPDPRPAGSFAAERPSGETDLTGALVAAARSLGDRAPARRRKLLVLSDGRAEAASGTTLEAAAGAIRESGAEAVFFAVGADADVLHLDRLAAACGGRSVRVEDPAALPAAVAEEAAEVHRGIERHPLRPCDLSDRLPTETPPTLERARCVLRAGAAAAYAAVEPEPLLSFWRAGAGVVAAFCSTPGGEEAPAWAEATAVWEPLLGLLCRAPGGDRLRYEPERLLLETDGDAGDEPDARVAMGASEVRLERIGRRLFAAPWRPPSSAPVGALVRRGLAAPRPAAFSGSFCPPEFRGRAASVLAEIARATGAAGPDSPTVPPPARGGEGRGKGGAEPLAAAGLFLLLLSAGLRAVPERRRRRSAQASAQAFEVSGR
ncbi:MAG TPA: vWA domain-containing protein [Planctomycetota bacterium]|nr:vWA domain-containing protein [Planctomycetota bacterium]